ncbi:cytochrome P450 [Amycolatopsis antarctica]|uniref:Cytochrome P450 n=1 Tax=Amycolatopsis antarctica TaxID=1854586 RepID=A0A263CW41_9PSEU|nr:cytochrome P450 [Amycolatopsis antarctica]OZM70352.1 cytochrome P450 [Amycolatopsis antarctica]
MSGDPPGPQGDRLTGNLHSFTSDPLGFLTDCAREYGDVVNISSHNVLLGDPGDIERMLVDREGVFAKTTAETRQRTRKRGFPRAMMNSEGADWRHKRTRVSPAFTRALVAGAADLAHQEASELADRWPTGEPLDPAPAVARLALRTVTKLMFGSAMSDEDVAAVSRLVREIMDVSLSPITLPDWVPAPRAVRMRRALRDVDRVIAGVAGRSHAADPSAAPVLRALLDGDPAPSQEELRDELATLVLSGFETTKNAVLWCCEQLARHPAVADRVAAEATAAETTAAEGAGAGRLAALPFTDAVVRETMRLYPPAWLTSRETIEEVEFGGYRIAPGTTVTVSQWVTHRDPRWHADPAGFRPERWLGGAGQPPRGAYFPFGLGPRACIGAAVAGTEVTVVVAELCRRFRFELDDPAAVRPRPALSLQPSGLGLRLRARQVADAAG